MRIGIEAQRIFRRHKHGMDVFALHLIRHLQQIDRENDYVIFARPGEDTACLQETDNFRIRRIEALNYGDWEQIRLPRALERERIDMLHCTANTAPLWTDVPLVLTLHDLFFMKRQPNSNTYQKFGNLYRRSLVDRLIHAAARIVTVSFTSKQEILGVFPEAEYKLDYIHHGIDERYQGAPLNADCMKARRDYQLPARYYLVLGNTDPRKNTRGILAGYAGYAARMGTTAAGLVVTGLSRENLEAMLASIHAEHLAQRIQTPGYIAADLFPAVYSMSRGLIFASIEEGFGFPILEAMACQTPVITSDCSAMPEIGGSAALYVNPERTESITAALVGLESDARQTTLRVADGFQRSRRFSWTSAARRYLEVYEQCHAATHGASPILKAA